MTHVPPPSLDPPLGSFIINWLSRMQNIMPKRLYNAFTIAKSIPLAPISLDNIPLQVRVDNSALNARERVDIAIIRLLYCTQTWQFWGTCLL